METKDNFGTRFQEMFRLIYIKGQLDELTTCDEQTPFPVLSMCHGIDVVFIICGRGVIFFFSTKTYVVGVQKNRHIGAVLFSTQNSC